MSTSTDVVVAGPRRTGQWLVASGVVFAAGFALAAFAPEGSWLGDLVALPLTVGALLLVVATVFGARTVRQRPLAVGAVVLAAVCALAIVGLMVVSVLIEMQQASLEGWLHPLVILACAAGGAGMAALAVAVRAAGYARRTALVVAVLGVLVLLACFVMEPIAPFVLAIVLGVSLARSTESATM
jgi:hypothetical protein